MPIESSTSAVTFPAAHPTKTDGVARSELPGKAAFDPSKAGAGRVPNFAPVVTPSPMTAKSYARKLADFFASTGGDSEIAGQLSKALRRAAQSPGDPCVSPHAAGTPSASAVGDGTSPKSSGIPATKADEVIYSEQPAPFAGSPVVSGCSVGQLGKQIEAWMLEHAPKEWRQMDAHQNPLLVLGRARISSYVAIAARGEDGKLEFLGIDRKTVSQAVTNIAKDVPGASVGPGLTSLPMKVGAEILDAEVKALLPIPGYALERNVDADGKLSELAAMFGFVALVSKSDLLKGQKEGSATVFDPLAPDPVAMTAKLRGAISAAMGNDSTGPAA